MSNALVCLNHCPHVQPPPYSGACACLYDPAAPVDIHARVASGTCPAGRFDDPVARYNARPPLATAAELEELAARDKAEGGCGCAGGTTDVTRPK